MTSSSSSALFYAFLSIIQVAFYSYSPFFIPLDPNMFSQCALCVPGFLLALLFFFVWVPSAFLRVAGFFLALSFLRSSLRSLHVPDHDHEFYHYHDLTMIMTMNMNLTMTITITKHSFALVAMALQRRILKMDLLPSTSVFSNANHCILDDCEDLQRRVVYKKIRHVSIQNSAAQKQKSTLLIPPTKSNLILE